MNILGGKNTKKAIETLKCREQSQKEGMVWKIFEESSNEEKLDRNIRKS